MAVVILVGKGQTIVAVGGDASNHVDAHGPVRAQAEAVPDRNDRIEYGTRATGKGACFAHCARIGVAAAAPDEAHAVGLERDFLALDIMQREQMEHPRLRLAGRTWAARAQDRIAYLDQFGLHEQVAECWVQVVADRGCQHDFGIAGDLKHTLHARTVGDSGAAQFDIVFGRYDDLGMRVEQIGTTAKFDARLGEHCLVRVVRGEGRLERGRPDATAFAVAQVAVHAPRVASHVLTPARQRKALPAAIAATGRGHHHVVAAVRKQLHRGTARVCLAEHAQRNLRLLGATAHIDDLRVDRPLAGRARHALLQQQQCGLELRMAFEAALHRSIEKRVRSREQAHALMMGHERAHDRMRLARLLTRGGVVDGLVKAVIGEPAKPCHFAQVVSRLSRQQRQRESAGIRRDHQFLRQATLQAEPWHAKCAVLVVLGGVGQVVAGFGNAPRHVVSLRVRNLPRDHRLAGLCEQRARKHRHHQQRHQVFEHRAAPGEQRRGAFTRGEQATECKPAFLGDLPVRDRGKHPKTHFGREQIVVPAIALGFAHVVADREQMALRVVQKPIVDESEFDACSAQSLDRAQAGSRTPASGDRLRRDKCVRMFCVVHSIGISDAGKFGQRRDALERGGTGVGINGVRGVGQPSGEIVECVAAFACERFQRQRTGSGRRVGRRCGLCKRM